ncbi:MAG TPA: PilZ domain-containing protein [Allosphingosinicella sp.]
MLAMRKEEVLGASTAVAGMKPVAEGGEPCGAAVAGAMLLFRGHRFPAQVLDISSRGTMIECPIRPRLGETIVVQFDRCSPIQAFVRTAQDGRLGLRFGHEILLG